MITSDNICGSYRSRPIAHIRGDEAAAAGLTIVNDFGVMVDAVVEPPCCVLCDAENDLVLTEDPDNAGTWEWICAGCAS